MKENFKAQNTSLQFSDKLVDDLYNYESRHEKNCIRGFLPIEEVEGLFYLCSKNKGAVQLRGNRESDLPRCKHQDLQ